MIGTQLANRQFEQTKIMVRIKTKWESWRNENPGESGTTQCGFLAEDSMVGDEYFKAGTRVDLGKTGSGYRLVGIDGGFVSRHYAHAELPAEFYHNVEICAYSHGAKTLVLTTQDRAGKTFLWPYEEPCYRHDWQPEIRKV